MGADTSTVLLVSLRDTSDNSGYPTCLSAFLVLGVGCATQQENNQSAVKQAQVQVQQEIIDQQKASLEKLETKVEELEKKAITQQQKISTPPQVPKAITENLDLVLTNYKIDAQENDDVYEALLTAANSSPSQLCQNIIANRTKRQNLYYMVIDDMNDLEAKYGKYKNKIEYIGNNLHGLWFGIEIVKDKCASVNYEIE